jgi:hypothetical protein
VQNRNGKNHSSVVSGQEDSFVIDDVEADGEYEVSIRAVNEKGKSSGVVTVKRETDCKYQTHHFFIVSGV